MTIDINDPKLTAYALNELDDADRAEVELLLEQSPEVSRALAEIRRTASMLTEELTDAAPALLTDAQRQAIERQAAAQAPVRTMRLWIPFSAAASILLLLGVFFAIPPLQSARRTGSRNLANLKSLATGIGRYSNVPDELFAMGRGYPNVQTAVPSGTAGPVSDAGARSNLHSLAGADALGASEFAAAYNWSVANDVNGDGSFDDFVIVSRFGKPSYRATVPSTEGFYIYGRTGESVGGDRKFQVFLPDNNSDGISDVAVGPVVDGKKDPELVLSFPRVDKIDLGTTENSDEMKRAVAERQEVRLRRKQARERTEQKRREQIEQLFNSAKKFRKEQRFDEAAEMLRQIRYLDPKNLEARDHLEIVEDYAAIQLQVSIDREAARNLSEEYARIHDNPFLFVSDNPLSTFSIDVDTASYANIRRFLNDGQLPPADAVRIEEMINYFTYDYSPPEGDDPFGVNVEVAECPWTPEHRLVRIGLQGMVIEREDRPASNLVFLIDVSGSMSSNDKLPLLKQSLALLTEELDGYDRVAMVVYAGSSGLVLPSTTADNSDTILHALEQLSAGGSTNGGEGIQLAYDVATENFIEGGVNRVILATDGDFNVGITDRSALTRLIVDKAKTGVFLSVLGFGTGNLKDATMQKLADNGNGNYAYIDSLDEGRKVLVEQMGGTLITIAKDVKIQIEFNPAEVAAYRLIGYENRILAARDFNDDTKDAGEIGAGHTVTALYEIVPAGQEIEVSTGGEFETPEIDPLRYQAQLELTEAADSGELMTLKLRYKQPDGDVSRLMEFSVRDSGASLADSSEDFRFASAVASFGMLLRHSPHAGGWSLEAAAELAAESIGEDPAGYRRELLGLIERAAELRSR